MGSTTALVSLVAPIRRPSSRANCNVLPSAVPTNPLLRMSAAPPLAASYGIRAKLRETCHGPPTPSLCLTAKLRPAVPVDLPLGLEVGLVASLAAGAVLLKVPVVNPALLPAPPLR